MESQRPPLESDRVDAHDPIARVLKLAGARPQPDPTRTVDFKKTLHAEWHRVTEPRIRSRRSAWMTALASGIAAVLVLLLFQPSPESPAPAATTSIAGRIVRIEGSVRGATVGDEVRTGTVLETTDGGRIALQLDGGTSLRIDVDSRIAVTAERTVRVERGALYVDSGPGTRGPVLVQTENGDVRDIGTQFEVRADRTMFRVRVREGEVLVSRRDAEMTARAGEALHVDPQGRYVRSTIATSGRDWAWTSSIAPPFHLEGGTVQQLLEWVAREQGWRWRFADDETARRAAGIVTHGSVEGYTPEEALAIVLPTCGLSFVRNEDQVVVSLIKESSTRGRS